MAWFALVLAQLQRLYFVIIKIKIGWYEATRERGVVKMGILETNKFRFSYSAFFRVYFVCFWKKNLVFFTANHDMSFKLGWYNNKVVNIGKTFFFVKMMTKIRFVEFSRWPLFKLFHELKWIDKLINIAGYTVYPFQIMKPTIN